MKSGRLARRLAATAGMGAIIAMGALTACGQGEKAPETTTPTTTTTTTTSTTTAPPAPPGADGKVDQPHRRQPVHASGQGAAGADGHPWRQLDARLVDQVQIAAAVTALLCRRSRRTPHGRWPCSALTA